MASGGPGPGPLVLRLRPGPRDAGVPARRARRRGLADAAQLDGVHVAFGIQGYRDYQELLDHEDIDIVHIAATGRHAFPSSTIRSARAGKHIVLGKPMAMTVDEADRMVEAVERPACCVSRFRASCGCAERT